MKATVHNTLHQRTTVNLRDRDDSGLLSATNLVAAGDDNDCHACDWRCCLVSDDA